MAVRGSGTASRCYSTRTIGRSRGHTAACAQSNIGSRHAAPRRPSVEVADCIASPAGVSADAGILPGPQVNDSSRREGVPNARRARSTSGPSARMASRPLRDARLDGLRPCRDPRVPARPGRRLEQPCVEPHWGFVDRRRADVRHRSAAGRPSRPGACSTCRPAARAPLRDQPAGARSPASSRSSRTWTSATRGSSSRASSPDRASRSRRPIVPAVSAVHASRPARSRPSRGGCPRTS